MSSSDTLSARIISSTPSLRVICSDHMIQRDGVQIHYVKATPSRERDTGITLVMIHGWPEFWYSWRHLMVSLCAVGYRCIAVDLRGMGESRVLDASRRSNASLYSWRQQSLDIISILDHEKIPTAVAIGHDWGGAVVWSLVRRFPSRFTGVSALCTPYRPRKKNFISTEQMAQMIPRFYYQVLFKNHRKEVATELNRDVAYSVTCLFRTSEKSDQPGKFPTPKSISFLQHQPKNPTRSRLHTDEEWSNYVAMYKQSRYDDSLLWYATDRINWEEEGVDENGKPMSPIVTQSALMITAGKDMILLKSTADGMEQWIPKLTRGHVEDSAHWMTSEQPKLVHQIVLTWLQQTQSSSSSSSTSIPSKL